MVTPPDIQVPVTDLTYRLASAFIISTTTAQTLATAVVLARVITRARPVWRFTIDDYLVVWGYALITVMYALMTHGETYALTTPHPPTRSFSSVQNTTKLAIIATPFWAWSIGIVKISIACMLLRFQQSRGWRLFLYSLIALNILLIGFTGIGNLFQCRPFKAMWDLKGEIAHKKCFSKEMDHASLYVSAAINVSTDIIFSLLPLTFLCKIRRPFKEKLVIWFLMALGLVASSLSLAKAVFAGMYNPADPGMDPTSFNILIGLLSCLEVQTAVIAACLPTLRGGCRRVLEKMGWRKGSEKEAWRYGEGSDLSGGPKGQRRPVSLREVYVGRGEGQGGTGMSESQGRSWHLSQNLPSRITLSSGSSGTAPDTVDEEIDETDFETDPKTGRVICTAQLRAHGSQAQLRDDWVQKRSSNTQEEWEKPMERNHMWISSSGLPIMRE
ncbi:hypothetical protein GQ43DRAFT_465469 [Delitschia confertaspora ATCC 74209]|uniref:Rhodopsin domain-containing protein n=1 Tax=Delitschia confertaspora ATCC 74209 TaxID=1513339 RepID=A0A9P4JIE9_9PLEO|nr:hypothetical protein GQ43DRAFT_465469 [Delitschia confertaspora ATCC 74209]